MSCCGQRRAQITGSGGTIEPARAPRRLPNVALYEYTGATGMTVTGPVSGMKYRFGQPGAQLQVDPRDVSSMAGLPNLSRIR
jgi:hypothetical protein